MSYATFQEIADIFRSPQYQSFLVISHQRPDGDALGSTLAAGMVLRALGKDVTLWNEDGVIPQYYFLPGSDLLSKPTGEPRRFDVVIAVDCATQVRLGAPLNFIDPASTPLWINIDHHVSNPGYGDVVYIDGKAPATGQVLAELIEQQALPMDAAIAENLFVAISTDTGSFQYPSTTQDTFQVAANLIGYGLNVGEISRRTYDSIPLVRLKLHIAVLNTMELHLKDQVAFLTLERSVMESIGASPDDTEGAINYVRALDTVMVAIFFEELADGKVRLSMRSKDANVVNVSELAKTFGGGGHALAAGARITGSLLEVKQLILNALQDAFRS
jgi:bifunctional oligoribonuclease and PAP phosphatase NrnA